MKREVKGQGEKVGSSVREWLATRVTFMPSGWQSQSTGCSKETYRFVAYFDV